MSLLVDFSIFPMDKGESVSGYVSKAVKIIQQSGLSYKLGPMGTTIEGEWESVMAVVKACFDEITKDSHRVYFALKADYRRGSFGRLESKVRSVETKL
jgi:uncharacterized protein (TIGR00106 family)